MSGETETQKEKRREHEARLIKAIAAADRAALQLNALGYEVELHAWTTPGNTGHVRMQGNSNVIFKKRAGAQ